MSPIVPLGNTLVEQWNLTLNEQPVLTTVIARNGISTGVLTAHCGAHNGAVLRRVLWGILPVQSRGGLAETHV